MLIASDMKTHTTSFHCVLVTHRYNGNLVTIELTRELLGKPEMSDEEATEIRDEFRMLAEVIFEKRLAERKAEKGRLPSAGANTKI